MTGFRIDDVPFRPEAILEWATSDPRVANWPVVYTLSNPKQVYVGESVHAVSRMQQHLARPDRTHLDTARIVIDPTFNKSACLDLESQLIAWFAGEGRYEVENANAGLTGSNYYEREVYREQFRAIFDDLRAKGLFGSSIAEIENSDLFKLSPFKTLTYDQRVAVMKIVEGLLRDLRRGGRSTTVVRGGPGTGKTIVGIYLMKLLTDIRRGVTIDDSDSDALFAGFFTPENAELLRDFRMGLVVPQQSLRETVAKVFRKTSGLGKDLVLSPYDVGQADQEFDLLIVDEAHRLQQLSATIAALIIKFRDINRDLFDGDEMGGNQLDWVRLKSRHQVLLLDTEQSIRPGSDLPLTVTSQLERDAAAELRLHTLTTQMRVRAGEDYIGYVRAIFSDDPPAPTTFSDYDFRLFDDLRLMRSAIVRKNDEHGLARLLAGFAWRWRSKRDAKAVDLEIDGEQLQWNRSPKDWVSTPTSIDEVGSIHTIQGYDLNYGGVIIGPDLRYDLEARRFVFARSSYYDVKGKQNNTMLGQTYSDDDLLDYIINIYRVLLTRGIRGTYVYVCDPGLRTYLGSFIPSATSSARTRPSGGTSDHFTPDTAASSDREATIAVELDLDPASSTAPTED